MKPRAFLIAGVLASGLACRAQGEDFVYLRKTTMSDFMPRYEVLASRPSSLNDKIIRVPLKDVEGLEKLKTKEGTFPNHYVSRTSPSVLPERYGVHVLQPGVSYMQSIGGGAGAPLYVKPKATPAPEAGKWQPRGTMLNRPAYRR